MAAQTFDSSFGIRLYRIGNSDYAEIFPVLSKHKRSGTRHGQCFKRLFIKSDSVFFHQSVIADEQLLAVRYSSAATSGKCGIAIGITVFDTVLPGIARYRGGKRVLAAGFGTGKKAYKQTPINSTWYYIHNLRLSACNRTGFIENNGINFTCMLKRFTVFYKNTHRSTPSHTDHDCCWSCESQSTRACDYKNGYQNLYCNAEGFSCYQPDDSRNDGYRCNNGDEYAADLIRKPCNGSFTALSLLNHSYHAGKHRVVADLIGNIYEAAACIDTAAYDLIADILIDGNAFAAQH